MKIAFFTDSYLPTFNGVVSSIINYSTELSNRGHKVMIVTSRHPLLNSSTYKVPKGVKIVSVTSVNARLYPDLRVGLPSLKLWTSFKEFEPELVHTFTPGLLGISGLMMAMQTRTPVITSHLTNLTDKEALKSIGLKGNNLALYLQKGVGKLLEGFLNRHKLVLVPTTDTARDISNLGVSTPIAIHKLPVPVEVFKASKEKGLLWRKNLGIKRSLIYVGRLSGEKNIDVLLKTFKELRTNHFSDLKLVLIGDGPCREELFSLAKNLGVLPWIVWGGDIPYSELVSSGCFYLGDVFVSFSKFETQGLTTVEAMSCGLPVVTTLARGSAEVVGHSGLLLSDNDALVASKRIAHLFEDRSEYARMSKLSVSSANDYTIGRCVDQLEEVYRRVIDEKNI